MIESFFGLKSFDLSGDFSAAHYASSTEDSSLKVGIRGDLFAEPMNSAAFWVDELVLVPPTSEDLMSPVIAQAYQDFRGIYETMSNDALLCLANNGFGAQVEPQPRYTAGLSFNL